MSLTLRAALGAALTMTAIGLVAWLVSEPMLFPSLGPSVMMLAEHPGRATSAPRSVVLGHGAALAVGWASLWLFGLIGAPSAITHGIDPAHVAAAATSVTLTLVATRLLRAPHAPAGATTLIVSLGLLPTRLDLAIMAAAIVGATALMTLYNRLLGQPAPLWRAGPGGEAS